MIEMTKHTKRTLAIDARMIEASGIGIVIKNILPALLDDFSVTLIGNKKTLNRFKEKYNISILHTNAKMYSLKILFQYPFFPRVDILWIPHFNGPIVSNAKKRVVTIHDMFHLDYIETLSIKQKIFARVFYYMSIRLSNHIVTDSHFTYTRIKHFFKVKTTKISIVHLGARTLLKPKKTSKRSEVFFLYVGNLKPHKNIKQVIYAYSSLSDSVKKNLKLKIVGKSTGFLNPEDNLKQLTIKLKIDKNVHFYEDLSDTELSKFFHNAEFLVLPSLYEGFGLPILESFSVNTPVLCSDIDVFNEVSGNAAMLFNPFSTEDLAKKITKLHQSPLIKKRLVSKGKKRLTLFSWEKCQNEYIEIFKSLME